MKKLFLSIIILTNLAACSSKSATTDTAAEETTSDTRVLLTDAQAANAGIDTARITDHLISETLRLNGAIEAPPQHLVSVSAPLGGYLSSTNLLPGMHVNKGQVIATMEDPQYIQLQQDYLLAKSKLHFAQLDYERQRDLNQSQAASDKAMQQAQAEMNQQQIMMNALAQKLRLIHINPQTLSAGNISKTIRLYSSINGYVSKVNVNIGRYVNPADALFELVNPEDIHLNLVVFEKDIDKLYIGQPLYAFTNAQPDKKYLCEILLISKNINNNGSTEVHCHFENYDRNLLPGMYMNAEVEVKNRRSKALPSESVVQFEGKRYVFVVTGKQQYEMREVQTGISQNGFTEILSTDLYNQTFVTKGAYTLLMKLKNSAEEE